MATTGAADQRKAVGVHPQGTVQIDGSDGEPDVVVTLTLKSGRTMVARSMPRTVQDVVSRIRQLGDHGAATAGATVDLAGHRLDVDVDLRDAAVSTPLGVGNPGTLGALVGLTGLEAGGAEAQATARGTDASFDVGFGIGTAAPAAGQERSTVLLPRDETLIEVAGRLRDPAEQRHRACRPGSASSRSTSTWATSARHRGRPRCLAASSRRRHGPAEPELAAHRPGHADPGGPRAAVPRDGGRLLRRPREVARR